jgi:Xaa-Pro aminopeptidase
VVTTHLAFFFFDGASPSQAVVVPEPEVVVKTGTGGIDPPKRRIYKPTGLQDRKKKTKVEERVEETRQIHKEVLEAFEEGPKFTPIPLMTEAEINQEIAYLMREVQKQQDEEDETLVLLSYLVIS